MPRPVAMRADYRNDAGFLIRLESAIVKDVRQTEDWRNETAQLIRKLSMRLLEADARKNMGGRNTSHRASVSGSEIAAKRSL